MVSYEKEALEFLRTYDLATGLVRKPLLRSTIASNIGPDRLAYLFAAAREDYLCLVPELPFLGPNNIFLNNLLGSVMFLAFCKVQRRQGQSWEQSACLFLQIYAFVFDRIPFFVRRLAGWSFFWPQNRRNMQAAALRSQQRRYTQDWVFQMVPADRNIDFAYDITECGILKFFQAQNAAELTPYACAMDDLIANRMDYSLQRTSTLAYGAPCCDFRCALRGPKTPWPPKNICTTISV